MLYSETLVPLDIVVRDIFLFYSGAKDVRSLPSKGSSVFAGRNGRVFFFFGLSGPIRFW